MQGQFAPKKMLENSAFVRHKTGCTGYRDTTRNLTVPKKAATGEVAETESTHVPFVAAWSRDLDTRNQRHKSKRGCLESRALP